MRIPLQSFLVPLSHCYTLRGDLYRNTTPIHLECRECFGAWKALGICQKKLVRLGGAIRRYCGIRITSGDKTPKIPLVAGAWRAQILWVDQAWRVFLISLYSNLFTSGSISTWRVTSWCYLVFASLFPYSLSFTFIVYSICLCLRDLFRFHCVSFSLVLHLDKLE